MRSMRVLLFLFGLFLLAEFQPLAAQAVPKKEAPAFLNMILASVDGEPLTTRDFESFLRTKGVEAPGKVKLGSLEGRNLLNDLIVEQLLIREAKSLGISVSEKEVSSYVSEIEKENGVNRKGFLRILAKQGIDFSDYQQRVRADILRSRVISVKVRKSVSVGDGDIKRYLEDNPDNAPKLGNRHVHQIIVSGSIESGVGSLKQACRDVEAAKGKLLSGSSWRAAGGANYIDLGFVDVDQLRDELKTVLESTEVGKLVGPLEVEEDCMLLMISSVIESEDKLNEELKAMIVNELFREKYREKLNSYLNEELPKKYHIDIKLGAVNHGRVNGDS